MEISSKEKLEEILLDKKGTIFVIDCWAPWCGPCKKFGIFYEKFIQQYTQHPTQKISFHKLNIDQPFSENFTDKYDIQHIPTILFFKNGRDIMKSDGSTEKFTKIIKELTSQSIGRNIIH